MNDVSKNLNRTDEEITREPTPFEKAEAFSEHFILSCTMLGALQVALEDIGEDGESELDDETIIGLADAVEAMYGISA